MFRHDPAAVHRPVLLRCPAVPAAKPVLRSRLPTAPPDRHLLRSRWRPMHRSVVLTEHAVPAGRVLPRPVPAADRHVLRHDHGAMYGPALFTGAAVRAPERVLHAALSSTPTPADDAHPATGLLSGGWRLRNGPILRVPGRDVQQDGWDVCERAAGVPGSVRPGVRV